MAKKSYESPEAAREAILDAAEAIAIKVGPAGLRLSAVAKQAGMAHPNIIHHFGSRDGLLNALADRVGEQTTQRITTVISETLQTPDQTLQDAVVRVLETVFTGDEGRLSAWLHMSALDNSVDLSGAQGGMKDNMNQIVDLSHSLRQLIDPTVKRENTSRIVLLVTLALMGEVVAGETMKSALGFDKTGHGRAHFKQWLASLLLNLSDEDLSSGEQKQNL
ncbi:MAG: TetR/AcrR family transcriptional regulator [Pseudomonadota bacterium]